MANITGTNNSETLNGGAEGDYIQGASGDDVLNGSGGNDTLVDSYQYESDDDAPTDADKLYGGAGNDVLIHYQGVSYSGVVQNTDGDLLDGGEGDDSLQFFGGQKGCAAAGGSGTDTLMFTLHGTLPNGAEISSSMDMELIGSDVSITVAFSTSNGTTHPKPDLLVSGTSIERVQFASGAGDDKMVGGGLDDTLESYGGRDEIHGNGGNDYVTIDLTDYAGNAPTNVLIDGGAGTADRFDFSSYISSTENFILNLSAGTYTADGRSLGPITGFESLSVWTRDGDDKLTGGALSDYLRADNGRNTLIGNGGNDALTSGDGVDRLDGGDGADSLSAGASDDKLIGGAGNDLLDGGSGNDSMNGGAGTDIYIVDYYYDYRDNPTTAPRDAISDSSGTDKIITHMSVLDMRFYATVENAAIDEPISSTITGNDVGNIIDGRSSSGLTADGGLGNDTILGSRYTNTLSGGGGDDSLTGGIYDDTLDGGIGKDTLNGADGNDIAKGGDGDDIIFGDLEQNNAGVVLGSGKITKASGQGDAAHPINLDSQFSLAANPEIDSATSLPHVTVAAKLNYVDYYNNSDFYTITLKSGTAIIVDIDTNSMDEFDATTLIFDATGEELARSSYGSAREKSTGSPNANDPFMTFVAPSDGIYTIKVRPDFSGEGGTAYRMHVSLGYLGGDDTLSGDAGNDRLTGGAGDDLLDGGTGNDTLIGGAGDDTYVIDSTSDKVAESTGTAYGTDTVKASVSHTLASNVENLVLTGTDDLSGTGNSGVNRISGNVGDNILDGKAGADAMIGGKGDDTYIVDNAADRVAESAGTAYGSDTIRASVSIETLAANVENLILTGTNNLVGYGNDLVNRITGNSGANTLDGGLGTDVLTGGAGRDTFLFKTTPSSTNLDHIKDFSAADDTIKLDNAAFQAFTEIGTIDTDAFTMISSKTATVDAGAHILYDKAAGTLYYDSNGGGTSDRVQFAILDNHSSLTFQDFIVG